MKVAIVGGGAAGMMTAYLLNALHNVTLFEKEPILGGNVRTINKNVTNVGLENGIVIDNGVIEFATNQFPTFVKMMESLQIELTPFEGNTAFYLQNGKYYLGPNLIKKEVKGFFEKIKRMLETPYLVSGIAPAGKKIKQKQNDLSLYTMKEFLREGDMYSWLRSLIMYAHSVKYPTINEDYPAEMGISILKSFGIGTKWSTIQSGIYTYMEKIVNLFKGKIFLNSQISEVSRNDLRISIRLQDGSVLDFEKVIFATPPEQVLKLLKDPTENETKRFAAWKTNQITTFIHTDRSIYNPYPIKYYSEFDIFETTKGDYGYNAYMNRISNIKLFTPYFMAYNMENVVDSRKIAHKQIHHTPLYTLDAMKYRQEIIETNGENNTYFVGAYLYNGLHEGAALSAKVVAPKFMS